jgi:hypothetical protein
MQVKFHVVTGVLDCGDDPSQEIDARDPSHQALDHVYRLQSVSVKYVGLEADSKLAARSLAIDVPGHLRRKSPPPKTFRPRPDLGVHGDENV